MIPYSHAPCGPGPDSVQVASSTSRPELSARRELLRLLVVQIQMQIKQRLPALLRRNEALEPSAV
jgi:hypothetical protein